MKKRLGPRNLKEAVSRMFLLHRQKMVPDSNCVGIGQLDFEWMKKKIK